MMQVAAQIISIAAKGIEVAASVTNAVVTLKKNRPLTTEEKVTAALEIVFSFVQTADVVYSSIKLAAPDVADKISAKVGLSKERLALGLSVTAGGIEVGKTVTVKLLSKEKFKIENLIEIIGIVVFRAGDAINHATNIENIPEEDKEILSCLDIACTGAGTLLNLGSSGYKIYRNKDVLYKATQIILRRIRGQNENAIPVLSVENKANAKDLLKEHQKGIRDILNWENLKEIPPLLHCLFQDYICPISQKPIRNPVKITNGPKIWYEERLFHQFKIRHPNLKPPGWPEEQEYKPAIHKPMLDREVFNIINKRLQEQAELMRMDLNN
ncbi:MAG: hypothetical protein J0H93_07430 [Chlamydiales bacterium]|nr:hypothetical protein [Chlamydiales bacterium]